MSVDDGAVVLRAHLPMPRGYRAPRTETERALAAIWSEVLNMDLVGVEDVYTDLGGDSFLAALIFERIEDSFGVALPLATLAKAQTVAALALVIDGKIASRPTADATR